MAAVDLDANWSARLLAIYASRVRPAVVFSMLDATVIALSMAAALLLRFDGHPPPGMWPKAIAFALAAIVVFLAWGRRLGVYGQVWSYASIREAGQVLLTGVLATLTLTVLSVAAAWASQTATDGGAGLGLFQGEPMPRSVPLIGGILATGVLGLTRYQSRLFSRRRMDAPSTQTRVLIVGAGEIGAWLVHQFRETAAVVPVGFVDDAPAKRHGRIGAVRVLGDSSDIADLVQRHLVDEVIVAIGTPDPEHLRRVAAAARSAGAVVKTVPTVSEILFKGMRPDDLRSLETEQLLGRTSVQTDLTTDADLIRGRTVLVTGAGGSIGSEIARQVSAAEPARLLVLDNDETHLHDLRPDLPDDVTEYLLADIRDGSRIRRLVDHLPTVDRFSRRGAQARPDPRAAPVRGSPDERAGYSGTAACVPRSRGRALHLDLHGQGGRSEQRDGRLQASGGALGCGHGSPVWAALRVRALRERPGQPRERRPDLRSPDPRGRSSDDHGPADDPLLHDDPGGDPPRLAGGGAGSWRRDPDARHGRSSLHSSRLRSR